MIINKPEIVIDNESAIYQSQIICSNSVNTLWYSIDSRFDEFINGLSDGFLVALLIPAMELGEDIYIKGAVSERLLYNLSGPFQQVLKEVIPFLQRIKIYVDNVETGIGRASGVATGFSCGIDSYCVLADHFFNDVSGGFRITHLLYNNVGSHFTRGTTLFEKRFARIKPIAEKLSLPIIKVNSNLDAFYQDTPSRNLGYAQTHTMRNASVPLILQGGIGRFMFASDYDNKHVFIGPSTEIAHINPIILASLSTEAMDMLSVGGEYTRVEKTLKVGGIPLSYDLLDVCWTPKSDGSNCSKCPKCMNTLLTLDIAGLIDRYKSSFCLKTYYKKKDMYLADIIRKTNPLFGRRKKFDVFTEYYLESFQFAKERNFSIPKRAYVYAWLGHLHFPKRIKHLFEQIFILYDRVNRKLNTKKF